jgi:membrane protein DedA with SNARE-associated domain
LAASGRLDPLADIGLATLACLIADSTWFYLGRHGGKRVLDRLCRLSLAKDSCVGRSERLFARHGLTGVFAAKFLPGLGAVMPPLAGAFGVSAGRFLLFDGLGSLLYASVYVLTGLAFSDQVEQMLAVLGRLGLGALGLVVAMVAGYAGFKYIRRFQADRKRGGRQVAALAVAVTPSLQHSISP